MRILVDIEEPDLKKLDLLAKNDKRSRASVIREAIVEYLDKRSTTGIDEAFGLWSNRQVDGLEYQQKLRSEW